MVPDAGASRSAGTSPLVETATHGQEETGPAESPRSGERSTESGTTLETTHALDALATTP